MWSSIRGLSTNLLYFPPWFTQSKRTTYILRRTRQLKLNKLGAMFPKRIKRQGYYYELVRNTDAEKKPPLEVVLTKDVSGVGMKGEKIEQNMFAAYRDLLLPKLAVYADSPEAEDLMRGSKDRPKTSIYSRIVENYLATQKVVIILSYDLEWTLQPWHVKLSLRKNGIMTNEDCIIIPNEISGPNPDIENKDFLVYIIMNKSEKFPIRCRIYHWSTADPTLNQKSFDINTPSTPLFPDEKEKIDALIKTEQEIMKMEKLKGLKREGRKY